MVIIVRLLLALWASTEMQPDFRVSSGIHVALITLASSLVAFSGIRWSLSRELRILHRLVS